MLQKVDDPSATLAPRDTLIVDFGFLAAAIGRLSAAISAFPAFKQADLTASEWVALLVLGQRDRTSNNQLAKRLGVSRQRAHQILTGFVANSLVTLEVSPVDTRRNEIVLTEDGRLKLERVNEELQRGLAAAFGRKTASVSRTRSQVVRMTRLVERSWPPVPAVPAKESPAKQNRKKKDDAAAPR